MREIRPSGSEGGGAKALPTPIFGQPSRKMDFQDFLIPG